MLARLFWEEAATTSVLLDDLTLEVGDSVVVENIRTLFTDHIPMSFAAGSSDTTVVGAWVRGAVRLTITARMLGSADVSVTATEPGPDPNRPAGVGPQGRSATRTAKVTVIDP